jgi:hypothetical protein
VFSGRRAYALAIEFTAQRGRFHLWIFYRVEMRLNTCPASSGKSLRAPRAAVSSHICENILIFRKPKSDVELPPSTPLGRIAIVTDAGLDAMDAAALLTNSANAGGKAVWSRRPDAGVQVPGKHASQGRRWQESPDTEERAV